MALNKQKLVIVGDGETGEIAYEYFTADTNFEVVAFSAEKKFIKKESLFDLPVIAFEDLETVLEPKEHVVFVAISFTQLNHLRVRLLRVAKEKGFRCCSYISPRAFIGKGVEIGENCFIFENVVLQRGVKIGNNVILWTGSTIAHRSIVEDNCFLASNVTVSGFCRIGENSFLGANSCTIDKINVAKDSVIGAGAVIINDTESGKIYVGNPAKPIPNKSAEQFISDIRSV